LPLALMATAATATEILIYTLSDKKLSCGERLRLRAAGHRSVQTEILANTLAESKSPAVFADIPNGRNMLCKFKSRLTAEQMKRDLEFDPAPDNGPYAERRIVW